MLKRTGRTGTFTSGRRKARTLALQALYQMDAVGHEPDACLQALTEGASYSQETVDFARQLSLGVRDRQEEVDAFIGRFAPAWPVRQLAVVDRCTLRLAIYELLAPGDTPPKVVINEAVELAKAFGAERSPAFINGVLGSVLKALHPAERESPQASLPAASGPGQAEETDPRELSRTPG